MKNILLCLLFLPCFVSAQDRNEQVRDLNAIVDLMNEASRLNQTCYFDVEQLAKAVYESRERLNPNYFYAASRNQGMVYYSGMEQAFRFKELVPDKSNRLPGYMADRIPYYEAREKVQRKRYPESIAHALTVYIRATDSLHIVHDQLADYSVDQAFRTDEQLVAAKALLQAGSYWFEACHAASEQLYSELERCYLQTLPPNKTHAAIRNAEWELQFNVAVLNRWQKELYDGDNSSNQQHDATIRKLNETGLCKDSVLLFKTRGYGNLNSGWWAHTRYRQFFTGMQSTLFWYVTATYSKTPYLKLQEQQYNRFVLSYNPVIEDYNDFIAIADGKTFTETVSCCLGPSEIDTDVNVLLKKPRLLYQYTFTETEKTIVPEKLPEDTLSAHQRLISNALPHQMVYLLDASASMNDRGRLEMLKKNARYIVGLQSDKDRISIVSFATKAHVILKNKACDDKAAIFAIIDRITARGSTNISEGVEEAFALAKDHRLANGRNKILLITDGRFEMDESTLSLLRTFEANGIEFCIIYLGEEKGKRIEKSFRSICEQANGRFYNINDVDLQEVLLKEASE
jgi:Mg-chelatase subunit ChlD